MRVTKNRFAGWVEGPLIDRYDADIKRNVSIPIGRRVEIVDSPLPLYLAHRDRKTRIVVIDESGIAIGKYVLTSNDSAITDMNKALNAAFSESGIDGLRKVLKVQTKELARLIRKNPENFNLRATQRTMMPKV